MEAVLDFLLNNLGTITAIVIPLVLAGALVKNITGFIKEIGEALVKFGDMMSDSKVTKEEWEESTKEVKDVIDSFRLLFGKQKSVTK